MANSTKIKLTQAASLLILAVAGISAELCSFKLDQTLYADVVRIKVGKTVAFVQTDPTGMNDGIWNGTVINGKSVTLTDQTGSSSTCTYDELPRERKEMIIDNFDENLGGISVFNKDIWVYVGPSDQSLNITYKVGYKFEMDNNFASLYIGGAAYDFAHIFYQNNSAVTLVDQECRGIKVVPLDTVDPTLQRHIAGLIEAN